MKQISHNQLIAANDRFSERMYHLGREGAQHDEDAVALAARSSLLECAPLLVRRADKQVEVEAFQCEGLSLEGVTSYKEVAYRGIYRASIAIRQADTNATTGQTLVSYGFTLRVEQEFDRATDPTLAENAVVMADFADIDRLILHSL